MVVFACITTEGYINPPESSEAKCVFNKNNSACQYAVGIGVLGFLACMAFLLLDVYVSFTSNMAERKYSVLADLGFSGTHVCGFHFFFLSKMYSYFWREFLEEPRVSARGLKTTSRSGADGTRVVQLRPGWDNDSVVQRQGRAQ